MQENTVVAIDFETTGLAVHRPGFKVVSLAISWGNRGEKVQSEFFNTPELIDAALVRLQGKKVIVYNIGFEKLVLDVHYPHIKLDYYADVMRLSQLRGIPVESKDPGQSLGLKATTARFLPHKAGYEKKYYQWLRDNLQVKPGKEGAFLSQLPEYMLKAYNCEDTECTLALFWYFTDFFASEGYNWQLDNDLYMSLVQFAIAGEINGISVDKHQLESYIEHVNDDVDSQDSKFMFKYRQEIANVREQLRLKLQAKFKKKIVTEAPGFNITSKKHLEALFCGQLGLNTPIKTPKGSPSFKDSHLSHFGEGGLMLAKRGKMLIAKSHAKALIAVSEDDGRFHAKLRVCGTRTGRLAAASVKKEYGVSCNIQALSRNNKPLISALRTDPGWLLVESDFMAGEPTIISALTRDKNYTLINYTLRGKPPYMEGDLFLSSDPYISLMSIAPNTAKIFKDWLESFSSFEMLQHMWVTDKDSAIEPIKKYRKLMKIAFLALGYGCQSRKLRQIFNENGFNVSEADCEALFETFWHMFNGVERFNKAMQNIYKRQGYIYNPFGFRISTEKHKVYNALIQSSLNGVMSLYIDHLSKSGLVYKPFTIIHDSLVFQIRSEDRDNVGIVIKDCITKINEELKWSVNVAFDYHIGENMYDCKG
jgi:DNA polymerase I-like protein with 3'-5' exonuclease and polymerase domains